MTTNDIDWGLAPKGAVSIGVSTDAHELNWMDAKGRIWLKNTKEWSAPWYTRKTIATRPTQRKTVKDAVEYYNGVWPKPFHKYLHYMPEAGNWLFQSSDPSDECLTLVCTREEFEKCAEKQKESEWDGKGLPPVGSKCICNDPIKRKDAEVWIVATHAFDADAVLYCKGDKTGQVFYGYGGEFKPIKPTITKAEAWDKLTQEAGCGVSFNEALAAFKNKYTITD